jgi:hypothetical protein
MSEIYLDYSQLKALIIQKDLLWQYTEDDSKYDVFATDSNLKYETIIWKVYIDGINEEENNTNKSDFETNYKSLCNQALTKRSSDGKIFVRSESRPIDCTTVFTCNGDTIGGNPSIGTGARLDWDASIGGEWTTSGCPFGFKKSVIEIQFCDSIWIKEGTIYYLNAQKKSYLDLEIICPNGGYYMYLGEICQNITGNDLVVEHYVIKHPIQDDVPMGDKLNTEACSQELPSYLKYRLTVTVPVLDLASYGYVEFEIYRRRTVIL